MRRVQVLKFERQNCQQEVDGATHSLTKQVLVPDYLGLLHTWGLDSEEGETYTVAIVEDGEGLVHLVHPGMIKFMEVLDEM